ncbi:hypothetical protein [Luteolibacter marinus]|uniref:hypothetical protein n=1 Tax=Luteolibacter marinus TaxID=2776705 RepID=UPI0018663CD3|nr:hypothetical protein [Luteolibacter marinus]
MPHNYDCWRCKRSAPFFTEAEWQQLRPLLDADIAVIKAYREATHGSLDEAIERLPFDSIRLVERWTGYLERDPGKLYHHRLADWGGECMDCGQLFRSPQASFCASCGADSTRQAPTN